MARPSKNAAPASTVEQEEVAVAPETEQEEVAKAVAPQVHRVFYRELTATGRDGDVSHKVFDNYDDAKAFADEVGGRMA